MPGTEPRAPLHQLLLATTLQGRHCSPILTDVAEYYAKMVMINVSMNSTHKGYRYTYTPQIPYEASFNSHNKTMRQMSLLSPHFTDENTEAPGAYMTCPAEPS